MTTKKRDSPYEGSECTFFSCFLFNYQNKDQLYTEVRC